MINVIRFRRTPPWTFIALCAVACGCATPFSAVGPARNKPPEVSDRWSGQLTESQRIDIQIGLARTLERQGDLERAETIYRGILEKQPTHATTLHRLAIVYDQQLRFDDSGPLFRKALEQSPKDRVILGDYGYSLYRQNKWAEAEEIFRKVIAIEPHDTRAYTHLGLVLSQTDRREEALASFRKAGCSPSQAHSNLKTVMELNGRTEEAARESLIALEAQRQTGSETPRTGDGKAPAGLRAATYSFSDGTPESGQPAPGPRSDALQDRDGDEQGVVRL